jgi:hypothetical protein
MYTVVFDGINSISGNNPGSRSRSGGLSAEVFMLKQARSAPELHRRP